MKIRTIGFIVTLALGLLAAPLTAEAQQAGKVYRIGWLGVGGPGSLRRFKLKPSPQQIAFRQRLRELGYVEGQNIVIEGRFAEGKFDRFPRFAAELVRLKVDVIVTLSSPAARTANSVGTDGSKCRAAGQLLTLDRPRKVPQ